jgi:hypothetical protein
MNNLKLASVALLTLQWMFFSPLTLPVVSQSTQGTAPPPAAVSPPDTQPPLAREQQEVAERLGRLETLLLRSADLEAGENPARAALLQQAVQLSKQAELPEVLAAAAARLQQGQLSEAIEKQKVGRENLKRLLELLQSENREQRIREERDEVRRWIEETDRLLRLQSSLRGRTEGGQDTQQSAQDQQKLANKAQDIAAELKGESNADEATDPQPATDKSGDTGSDKPSTEKPSEPQPSGDQKSSDTQPLTNRPATNRPATNRPATHQATASSPTASSLTTNRPTASKPATNQPMVSRPTVSRLTVSQLTTSQLTTSQLMASPRIANRTEGKAN